MLIEPSVSWVDVVIVVCTGTRARAHVCVFLMLSRLSDVLWTFEVCSLHASLPTRTISSGFQLGITIYTSRSMQIHELNGLEAVRRLFSPLHTDNIILENRGRVLARNCAKPSQNDGLLCHIIPTKDHLIVIGIATIPTLPRILH